MRTLFINITACLSIFFVGCNDKTSQQPEKLFQYDRWTVSEPILQAGPSGSFDDVAVKDPSIVFYNGNYHLFYTTKFSVATAESLKEEGVPVPISRSGTGYLLAPTLEGLKHAKRYNLSAILNEVMIAPQVFFFEPHQLWYMIAHRNVADSYDLVPIYLTNPNIEDVFGWSEAHDLLQPPAVGLFWIDFRVICDDKNAHLFYTDHRGSLFRLDCPIEEFPVGFERARDSRMKRVPDYGPAHTVLTEWGEDDKGLWRLHEGVSIYKVKEANKYLALAEAVRPHPGGGLHWDSRNRFMFAFVSDKIEGPWERVERNKNTFAGDPDNLFIEDGAASRYEGMFS